MRAYKHTQVLHTRGREGKVGHDGDGGGGREKGSRQGEGKKATNKALAWLLTAKDRYMYYTESEHGCGAIWCVAFDFWLG